MEYDITGTLEKVDFGPPDILKEIMQNVKTILTTTKYSVPLDRNFGIAGVALDMPIQAAKAKLSAEIVAAIRQYEPRCQVMSVSFNGNGMDGVIIPTVRIRILEEYL